MIYADRKAFGMRLYAAVNDAGLTYKIICDELQIALATFHGWMSGNYLPRIDVGIRLSEMLNVDVRWLVYGDEKVK